MECNNKVLNSAVEKVISVAIGYHGIEQQTSMRQKLHKMSTIDTGSLTYETTLVINKPYIVTTNIDVSDGLANGATGKLIFIEYNEKGEASIQKHNLCPLAVPIDRRTSSIPLIPNKTVIVKRHHFHWSLRVRLQFISPREVHSARLYMNITKHMPNSSCTSPHH